MIFASCRAFGNHGAFGFEKGIESDREKGKDIPLPASIANLVYNFSIFPFFDTGYL